MLETPVVLLDNFDEDSQMLYQSMRSSGFSGPIITFSDDGYLPEDVTSIYTYYCGKKVIVVKKRVESQDILTRLMFQIIGKSRRVIRVVKSLI